MTTKTLKSQKLTAKRTNEIKEHIAEYGFNTMKEIATQFDISYWQARKICLETLEGQDIRQAPKAAEKEEAASYLMFMSMGLSLVDWERAMPIFIRVLEEPGCSSRAKETAKGLLIELGKSLSNAIRDNN